MIGSLRGEILERDLDGSVLIEVAGVGYVVNVSQRALAELEPSTSAFLYIHHHIREADQQLFGFLTRDERVTFQTLIGTHGVGPALGMAIIATHPPTALVDIVASQDVASLTLVPQGSARPPSACWSSSERLSVPILEGAGGAHSGGSVMADVREALAGLGYADNEISDTFREIDAGDDAATLLRDALKALGARRA